MRQKAPIRGMVHLNASLLCAIDTETTNLELSKAEILEIAIVPLNEHLEPAKEVMPFHLKMRPDFPDDIDFQAISVTRKTLVEIMQIGVSQDEGVDLFNRWFDMLELGFKKQIVPLGHNYVAYDRAIISKWMGHKEYDRVFSGHARDTMTAALWLNDRCYQQYEKVPFTRVGLNNLCITLKVERQESHTALADAVATAECYKRMMGMMTGILPEFVEEANDVPSVGNNQSDSTKVA